ncbi:unnamed protein product [Nippostrongylus brasiliensis]|uniref:Bis(5'-adenosyl)-triphosphatase n=1 Tax=Nippostrongylus brasiliensis TaxID=27835 RepID=A0A158R1D7_NIPBR|nr:unnamed protein product [Nippostrongylus brasiliensis]
MSLQGALFCSGYENPHSEKETSKKLNHCSYETLPHPANLSDLSSKDGHILHRINNFVKDRVLRNQTASQTDFGGFVPNIYNAAREGVWFTEGVSPQYVTMTSTNHMGLSTGLHAESHGVVGNVFYEKSTLRKFDYFNLSHTPGVIKDSKDPQWVRGEPIWVTNEKADATRHSACLYWPLGDIQFPNAEMPKFFKYVSEPDHTLHENGFFNGELPKTLKQLDEVFGYLIERLSTEELLDQINIVFTADHGHSEIEGTKKMMCIKDYVDYNRVHYAERMLYANDEETIQEAYRNLTRAQKDFKFKMYFRNDTVLKRYFYTKMPDRIGDIVLEPEVGYEVGNKCSKKELRWLVELEQA